jgi:hypothetical protein
MATLLGVFIGLIRALGFTITKGVHQDAITILAGPFRFWVAATFLTVIEVEASVAALFVTFIRFVSTLGITITVTVLVDALTVSTLPLVFLAATFLVVVEWNVSEAALLITFVRTI